MELLRYTQDAFGRSMLVGVNWDILWIPVAAAGALVFLHMLLRLRRRRG